MASSMSSGLPEVNVREGFRPMESGSCNFAKVQEEAPLPSVDAALFFTDGSILSWLLG